MPCNLIFCSHSRTFRTLAAPHIAWLADLQRFFTTFLEGRNDKEVRVSEWRQHPVVGRLREVSFVSAVKRTMGISPPFAHCHQTQRYRQAPFSLPRAAPHTLHGCAMPARCSVSILIHIPCHSAALCTLSLELCQE